MRHSAHLSSSCALVAAAAYVYEIKFESTLQAERLAKLRSEIRRERDAIATLRAEWAKLDNPVRIQGLAQRHLSSSRSTPARSTISTICRRGRSRHLLAGSRRSDRRRSSSRTHDIPTGSVAAEAGVALMAALQTSFAKKRAEMSLIARLLYGANVDRDAKAARASGSRSRCSPSSTP